jgi:cytochrome P450
MSGLLVDCYERFGPVLTLRILHRRVVFMLGPAATHYVTVVNASNFTVRESAFSSLIEFAGDGIVTTDGEYHRRMRKVVLPGLHKESVASYVDTIVEETERAIDGLVPGKPVNVYLLARRMVLRVSMRALFGFDPDGEQARSTNLLEMFDRFHAIPVTLNLVPLPFTRMERFMRMVGRLDQVIYSEIAARRARGAGGTDLMSTLLDARDEDGDPLTDLQIRDQIATLLLASTGATAAVMAFFAYELARHPEVVDRIVAEQHAKLDGDGLSGAQLRGDELVELEMALDEALRMYPAVWIGPRRATESFEFEGVTVPAKAHVNYSPLVSHHLPDVFPEPECYRPERFRAEAKAALPKGAYVPFGGGSRTCIGARLAQLEIRTFTSLLIKRYELEVPRDFSLKIGLLPMMKPKEGVPLIVRERAARRERPPAVAV